ncbi:hypothetical protein CEXT_414851 [Caerostris extrusa]|uniref:Uncharacterized protein n=1 Tax=Caerostris extrusa TaxID=172846 RepID=A0AAV4RWP3_CAEEX|nr:hypothetical protein CEXT_414851 [Caerostris extrusa]
MNKTPSEKGFLPTPEAAKIALQMSSFLPLRASSASLYEVRDTEIEFESSAPPLLRNLFRQGGLGIQIRIASEHGDKQPLF